MKNQKGEIIQLIKKIISFSPRQFEGARLTAEFIKEYFQENDINYSEQSFKVTIPQIIKSNLLVDGKKIVCQGASFCSGKIVGKEGVMSSLLSLSSSMEIPNINFNPYCDGISLPNYFWKPALAISRRDLSRVVNGKNVCGEIMVKPKITKSTNILLGNIKNPNNIYFTHYDSLGTGAIDNASGVAVMMIAIKRNPVILKNNLFVFSGCEELSYDKPYYWGNGYRVFEKKHWSIMRKTKRIIIVDGLGFSPLVVEDDWDNLLLGFPIKNLKKVYKKTKMITGNFRKLLSIYHSDLDDMRMLQERYLSEGVKTVLKISAE